jgi:hypothetical protein
MLKTLALTIALAASPALVSVQASAMPLDKGLQAATTDDVIVVREGCGPGMQYSNRMRRCVRDTPRAAIRDAIRRDMRDCGIGRHYSPRLGRCVRG